MADGDRRPDEETTIARFYHRIGRLLVEREPEPLLDEALELLAKETDAELAYVELRSASDPVLRTTYVTG